MVRNYIYISEVAYKIVNNNMSWSMGSNSNNCMHILAPMVTIHVQANSVILRALHLTMATMYMWLIKDIMGWIQPLTLHFWTLRLVNILKIIMKFGYMIINNINIYKPPHVCKEFITGCMLKIMQ